MTLEELNASTAQEFTAALADIFEHSPWVPRKVAGARPFASMLALHQALCDALWQSDADAQLGLIRAHPELAGRAAVRDELTPASRGEQQGAGLSACTPQQFERLHTLNAAYNQKFTFPFILAVKGHTPDSVIEAMTARLGNGPDEERRAALREICRIAHFRLAALIEEPLGTGIIAMAEDLARFSEDSEGLTCSYLSPAHRATAARIRDFMLAAGLDGTSTRSATSSAAPRRPTRAASSPAPTTTPSPTPENSTDAWASCCRSRWPSTAQGRPVHCRSARNHCVCRRGRRTFQIHLPRQPRGGRLLRTRRARPPDSDGHQPARRDARGRPRPGGHRRLARDRAGVPASSRCISSRVRCFSRRAAGGRGHRHRRQRAQPRHRDGPGRTRRHRADGTAPRCRGGSGRNRARGRAALRRGAWPGRHGGPARRARRRRQRHSRPLRPVHRHPLRRAMRSATRPPPTSPTACARSRRAAASRSSAPGADGRGGALRAALQEAWAESIARVTGARRCGCRAAPDTMP